ncbi:hypothetical protein [Aestuariivita sp.]|jgi:hypothetical protein|uniref:hypothetical protein n=1 Tax=Aestuariivita sp. TaxID=1872407 RepID=UPI002171621D|nr:hypothetical protein [Aestuariivita sp.]MCE8008128.1 hypothetical protein [Aestuariivita sp.]
MIRNNATYALGDTASICPRVAARLVRLGARVRLNGLGHRRLSAPDQRDLTAALLRDIDETILPRYVRVVANTGQRFALDIAGRRLLRLVIAGSGGSVGDPGDPVEAARGLARNLERALLRATEVTLQSHRMDSSQDRSDVGSSATALAAALGLDLDAPAGEDLTDKAMRSLRRHANAALVLDADGRITERLGEPGGAARLEALSQAHLRDIQSAMARSMATRDTPGCLILGIDATTGSYLIHASCDRARFLALVDAHRIDMLLPVLQDIFAH